MGGVNRGEDNGWARLTRDKVEDIRRRYAAGERPRDIARDHGIGRAYVTDIARGRVWPHVGGALPKQRMAGARNPRAKVPPEAIPLIRESDEPNTVLAKRYGVSHSAISLIRRGRSWGGAGKTGKDRRRVGGVVMPSFNKPTREDRRLTKQEAPYGEMHCDVHGRAPAPHPRIKLIKELPNGENVSLYGASTGKCRMCWDEAKPGEQDKIAKEAATPQDLYLSTDWATAGFATAIRPKRRKAGANGDLTDSSGNQVPQPVRKHGGGMDRGMAVLREEVPSGVLSSDVIDQAAEAAAMAPVDPEDLEDFGVEPSSTDSDYKELVRAVLDMLDARHLKLDDLTPRAILAGVRSFAEDINRIDRQIQQIHENAEPWEDRLCDMSALLQQTLAVAGIEMETIKLEHAQGEIRRGIQRLAEERDQARQKLAEAEALASNLADQVETLGRGTVARHEYESARVQGYAREARNDGEIMALRMAANIETSARRQYLQSLERWLTKGHEILQGARRPEHEYEVHSLVCQALGMIRVIAP